MSLDVVNFPLESPSSNRPASNWMRTPLTWPSNPLTNGSTYMVCPFPPQLLHQLTPIPLWMPSLPCTPTTPRCSARALAHTARPHLPPPARVMLAAASPPAGRRFNRDDVRLLQHPTLRCLQTPHPNGNGRPTRTALVRSSSVVGAVDMMELVFELMYGWLSMVLV